MVTGGLRTVNPDGRWGHVLKHYVSIAVHLRESVRDSETWQNMWRLSLRPAYAEYMLKGSDSWRLWSKLLTGVWLRKQGLFPCCILSGERLWFLCLLQPSIVITDTCRHPGPGPGDFPLGLVWGSSWPQNSKVAAQKSLWDTERRTLRSSPMFQKAEHQLF